MKKCFNSFALVGVDDLEKGNSGLEILVSSSLLFKSERGHALIPSPNKGT